MTPPTTMASHRSVLLRGEPPQAQRPPQLALPPLPHRRSPSRSARSGATALASVTIMIVIKGGGALLVMVGARAEASSSFFDISATAVVHALRVAKLAPEEARRGPQCVPGGRACRRSHLAGVLHYALDDAYFAHQVHEEQHDVGENQNHEQPGQTGDAQVLEEAGHIPCPRTNALARRAEESSERRGEGVAEERADVIRRRADDGPHPNSPQTQE